MNEEKLTQTGNECEGIINSENHHISIFVSIDKILPIENFANIEIVITDFKNNEVYRKTFRNTLNETFPKMRINIDKDCICQGPFTIKINNINEEINYSFELQWTSILA